MSVMIAFSVLNLTGVSTTAFLLLRYFVLEGDKERAKSERLLLNVLPASVAARLRDSEGTIADGFDGVTVLFADIVDFTTMSATAAPEEVVELLNGLFSWFDRLAEKLIGMLMTSSEVLSGPKGNEALAGGVVG